MARIERGDPSVAMASYVMCLWLINQADGLADLIAPDRDMAALEREVQRAKSVRAPAIRKASGQWSSAPSPAPALKVMEREASLGKQTAEGLAALLGPGVPATAAQKPGRKKP